MHANADGNSAATDARANRPHESAQTGRHSPSFTRHEYRSLRRRLDRWEFRHLREHAAALAEQLDAQRTELEAERRAREEAEDSADSWRELAMSLELREGDCLGLTVDGTLHVVPTVGAEEVAP